MKKKTLKNFIDLFRIKSPCMHIHDFYYLIHIQRELGIKLESNKNRKLNKTVNSARNPQLSQLKASNKSKESPVWKSHIIAFHRSNIFEWDRCLFFEISVPHLCTETNPLCISMSHLGVRWEYLQVKEWRSEYFDGFW